MNQDDFPWIIQPPQSNRDWKYREDVLRDLKPKKLKAISPLEMIWEEKLKSLGFKKI